MAPVKLKNIGFFIDVKPAKDRQDPRTALQYLGEITTDDLLENIFSKFCIGIYLLIPN